jgi:Phage late-transcription coactivator
MATRDEKNTFSQSIMESANSMQILCIEAITNFCEKNNLEIEVAATLVNDNLRARIEIEAQELRYLPRSARLPI